MWIDIACAILLAYAFVTGFQKGVLKTFGIWISGAVACLLSILCAPNIILFLENSLIRYKNTYDIWVAFAIFIVLLFVVYLITKSIIDRKSNRNSLVGKLSGGMLFAGFMVGSLVVMLTFADKVNLVNQSAKDESKVYQLSVPVKEKTAAVLMQLRRNMSDIQEEKQG